MRNRRWSALLGLLVCWGLSLPLGWFLVVQPYLESREIRANWKPAMSTVLRNQWHSGGEDSPAWSELYYEYEFGGRKYRGSRVSIRERSVALSPKQVGPGHLLRCFVNPANPSEAIIYPGFSPNVVLTTVLGVLFLGGFLMIRALLWPREEKEDSGEGAALSSAPILEAFQPLLEPGSGNYVTHTLRETPERLEYRPATGVLIEIGILLLIGCVLAGYGAFCWYTDGLMDAIVPLVGGGIFLSGGKSLGLRFLRKKAVFDREAGAFWRGKGNPARLLDPSRLDGYTPFGAIKAVQLLSLRIPSPDGQGATRFNYEMNLLRKDGTRVNVINLPRRVRLLRDAEKIAAFLNVPVIGEI